MKLAAALLSATLLLAPSAHAAEEGNCGTLVIPADNDITSFNPILGTTLGNAQAAQMLYMGLIWVDRHAQIDWSRSLASAVTTPDNGTSFIVTLRPWHWSDGVPVTSADVLYCYSLIKQLGPAYQGYGAGGMPALIKSVTAIDATHFEVILNHPVNPIWFIYNGLSQLQPLPAHDWSRYTLDQLWQLQSTPSFYKVIDGPMKLQSFTVGLRASYVPNPAFEGPKMHFNRFIFTFVESDGAAVQQIKSHEIDVATLPTELFSAVQHLPGIHTEVLATLPTWDYIALNLQNPQVNFFQDVRVRDAIADAQDQNRIINLVLHGLGYAVYAPITSASYAFEAPSIQQGKFPVGYDPARARALLAAAGFTPGPDGILQKNGKRLAFTVLSSTGSGESDEIDEVIADSLRAVGIDMQVREIAFNQMEAMFSGPATGWQAAILGTFNGGYPSGDGLFSTGGNQNQDGYSDKKMDALIDQSINKPGLDGLYAYEIYASAQQPEIFSASPSAALLVNNRLHGVNGFYDPGGLAPDLLYCTPEGSNA
jgi:peptide/nickel transport system substrate-binding protein